MIDFEFMLHGRNDPHFHIHGHGFFEILSKKLIFDPSVLHYLMYHELKGSECQVTLPDSLLKLISTSRENDEHKEFLSRFLLYFSYRRYVELTEKNWNIFYRNIEHIDPKPITLEDIEDRDGYESIVSMFSKHTFYVSLSPRMNFLGDVLAKIIEYSKKTGIAGLSKTRRLSNLLREEIITLELPKKFDNAVMEKQKVLGNLFNFQGGRAAKFFIGVVFSVGGFIHPVISVPGLIFVFMDP